jgi:hypothetical protein
MPKSGIAGSYGRSILEFYSCCNDCPAKVGINSLPTQNWFGCWDWWQDKPQGVVSRFVTHIMSPPPPLSWYRFVLVRHALYLPHEPVSSTFHIGYCWDRVLLYSGASLACNPPIYASQNRWDHKHMPLYPATGWDGVFWTFCLGWPWTVILLISTSRVARITDLIHSAPLIMGFSGESWPDTNWFKGQ